MPNYQNGLIYKLCCKDTDITDIYIGSTTSFRHRKSLHKFSCNNEKNNNYNRNVYKFIRENGGWKNWEMILIEYYKCDTKLELEKREREVIENLKPTLNKQIPTRSLKEYREDNKEKIIEQNKQYRQDNKEKSKEYYKEYYQDNKEQLLEKSKEYKKQYYQDNKEHYKEYMKNYREDNKEKKKEYMKVYRQKNKDKIKEYKKQYYQNKKNNSDFMV